MIEVYYFNYVEELINLSSQGSLLTIFS